MRDNQTARKRPFNISINEEIVHRARIYTKNLSATVESLLADFVAREVQHRRDDDAAIDCLIDDLNDFHHTNGLLSDEFSKL